MQFLLSCDECFVGFFIEGDIPEDGSCDEGSDLFNLASGGCTEESTVMEVVGGVRVMLGHFVCCR